MELLPAIFGLACLATVFLSRGSFLSIVLAGMWAASNIGWQLDALDMYPIMDAALACYALTIARKGNWQRVFFVATVVQLLLHICYYALGVEYVVTYLFLLNVTFAIELVAVSWEGLRDVRMDLLRCFRLVRSMGMGAGRLHQAKRLTK